MNSVTKINIREVTNLGASMKALLPAFISDTCKELLCSKLRKLDQKIKLTSKSIHAGTSECFYIAVTMKKLRCVFVCGCQVLVGRVLS